MRIIRFLGKVALWFGALLGVAAGVVWVADQLGWVQPLIVISGSMEPNIGTGDLLISRNLATSDVEVGDVVSLHSEMTDKLVTHRVTDVAPNDDGTWTISMKGDANDEPDLETYVVGESVLTPALQIPQGGKVVSKLMEPAVALPILLSLVALLGISVLDEPARPKAGRGRKRADGAAPDADADADTADDAAGDDDASMATELEPIDLDPIEDLDAALASVGALVGAGIDVPVSALVEVLVDAPAEVVVDAFAGDVDVSAADGDAAVDAFHDVDRPDDLPDLDSSGGVASVDDLDAALAAVGIDVGRLPAIGPRRATDTEPDTSAGLDASSDVPPRGNDPERRTDERDLVMSG